MNNNETKYLFTYLCCLGADPIIIGENQMWSKLPFELCNCVFEMARKVTNSYNPKLKFTGIKYLNVISQYYIKETNCDYILTDSNILLQSFRENTSTQPWFWLDPEEIKSLSDNDLDFYCDTFDLFYLSIPELEKFVRWLNLCLSEEKLFPIEKWTNFTFSSEEVE